MGPAALECRGLEKRYGERRAVNGVGFHIAEGETYGLLGPNGAGKTTTISMVCGILSPDAGEVTVCGHRMATDIPEAKGAIGYVPQDVALSPDLTGRENLRFFGRTQGSAAPSCAAGWTPCSTSWPWPTGPATGHMAVG